MASQAARFQEDNDSLHILPLEIVPLRTKSLRDARLVKNAHLESMVELFSDAQAGSGQIPPTRLSEIFDLSGERRQDENVIIALSALPSYDVYSLRLGLRELGIPVDESEYLRLSEEKIAELSDYMQAFTRPLVALVYGDQADPDQDFADIMRLFVNPDFKGAKGRLQSLADALGVDLIAIPKFLQRYADVYLSLAYYSYCLDNILPALQDFINAQAELLADSRYANNPALVAACARIEDRLISAETGISQVLRIFDAKTADMWQEVTGHRFREMEDLILTYQREIGGSVCALTVKMNAWQDSKGQSNLANRETFILSDMARGIEHIKDISFAKYL